MEKKLRMVRLEELNVDQVAKLLERRGWQEFAAVARDRHLDGRKLHNLTTGVVKSWHPKADAEKLIAFIAELKEKPDKYLNNLEGIKQTVNIETIKASTSETSHGAKLVEAQYQTVNVKRVREQHFTASNTIGVEDILKKITPPKSFLYRNRQSTKIDKPVTSYVPMDVGTSKKTKRFFRISSYEHLNNNLKQIRFSRTESQTNYNDRGYYSIKTNNNIHIQKTSLNPESKTKYNSLVTPEELNENFPEDHFYEDLDTEKGTNETKDSQTSQIVKPYRIKIQELFQSLKLPFHKKSDEVEGDKRLENNLAHHRREKDTHIYENSDSLADIYDSVQVRTKDDSQNREPVLPVEEYLEPVQRVAPPAGDGDYCDVDERPRRDDSLLGIIMSLIETRFRRRDVSDTSPPEAPVDPDLDSDLQKTQEKAKNPQKSSEKSKMSMTDRPLPVPVENEPYYMDIERSEAENLLRGTPDGTFVLRPSSQPNHAFTLTVSCSGAVHNVGVRRRADGALALGFARRGERSFAGLGALLRHHRRRRLLLVAGGRVCGATTLNDTPQYYHTPSGLPVSALVK